MTAQAALTWMRGLVSVSVLVQTLELFYLKDVYSASGIWRWSDLRPELGDLLGWVLSEKTFGGLLLLRFFAALVFPITPNPAVAAILFFTTLLICVRWRGTFNGGSDSMTVLVLGALLVSLSLGPQSKFGIASLMYVGVQTCFSYFVAGLAKVRRKEWRNGVSLSRYVHAGYYDIAPVLRRIWPDSSLWKWGSWLILTFELASPVAFWSPGLCKWFIGLAALFHFVNSFALGLNRFFFAWAAAWPALLFCSQIRIR